ncbi:Beta-glucosidase 44 [Orobanche hederae]
MILSDYLLGFEGPLLMREDSESLTMNAQRMKVIFGNCPQYSTKTFQNVIGLKKNARKRTAYALMDVQKKISLVDSRRFRYNQQAREDIDLMAKLNFDAYIFSISWSTIFPNGTGKVNMKGVVYHNRLIYMLEKGITPYPNLNHSDLPEALQDRYNRWLGRQVVKDFADSAKIRFKTFGDRVRNSQMFNEPRVVAALGYDTRFFAPGRCSKAFGNFTEGNSATEPYIVAHILIPCHAAAAQRYRDKSQVKQKGRIEILLDFVWYEPLTRSKADNYAAQRARTFHIGW